MFKTWSQFTLNRHRGQDTEGVSCFAHLPSVAGVWGTIMDSILQRRKLRHRKAKALVQERQADRGPVVPWRGGLPRALGLDAPPQVIPERPGSQVQEETGASALPRAPKRDRTSRSEGRCPRPTGFWV